MATVAPGFGPPALVDERNGSAVVGHESERLIDPARLLVARENMTHPVEQIDLPSESDRIPDEDDHGSLLKRVEFEDAAEFTGTRTVEVSKNASA